MLPVLATLVAAFQRCRCEDGSILPRLVRAAWDAGSLSRRCMHRRESCGFGPPAAAPRTAPWLQAEVMGKGAALFMNINAAKGLHEVMKTNLGPKGTIKMLVGGAGGEQP